MIGLGAVAIDFLVYQALLHINLDHNIAKAISFVVGGVWAYVGNRFFTFKRVSGGSGFALFWVLYLSTLAANVFVNEQVLALAGELPLPSAIAFGVATFFSAALNFIGMKAAVFRSSQTAAPV